MSKILKSFGMAALLVALLAGTGMGANTDTTDVTGTLQLSYDITSPEAIAFGDFNVDQNNNVTTNGDTIAHISVTTNGAVTLYALEAGGDGKMNNAGNTLQLGRKLSIKATGETGIMLSGTPQAVKALTDSNTAIETDFGQYVASTDKADDYTITVTFQGTAS
jgi:hypothetical protein